MKMWHIRLGSPFSEAILQETNITVFSLNSESCIRETLLQQEKSKLCFSPSLNKGQQMPAELLPQRVLRAASPYECCARSDLKNLTVV